jgi:hypothetical protein
MSSLTNRNFTATQYALLVSWPICRASSSAGVRLHRRGHLVFDVFRPQRAHRGADPAVAGVVVAQDRSGRPADGAA